jgi:hypothetical protein
MVFDAPALDLGAGEDFLLSVFQQLIFGPAETALRQARRRPGVHVIVSGCVRAPEVGLGK